MYVFFEFVSNAIPYGFENCVFNFDSLKGYWLSGYDCRQQFKCGNTLRSGSELGHQWSLGIWAWHRPA